MMTSGSTWKTLEFKSHGFHQLVIIRHRDGQLPDWSVDQFHNFIYKGRLGRWLRIHRNEIHKLARVLLKDAGLESEVFPSDHIVMGRKKAREKRGCPSDSGGADGLVSTMATPVWLLLYLLLPNCACNSKSRVKEHIAEKAFSMLRSLVQIAYEGHSAASATGSTPDMLTLHTHQGLAKVRQDGTLEMDCKLAAWSKTWSAVESQGNLLPGVYVNPQSVAGVLWLWSRIIVTHQVGRSNIMASVHKVALNLVNVVLEFLQLGLSRWAVEQQEPCTAQLIALQQGGRRTHPAILARLMRTAHKGKAVRSWKQLGLQVETSVESLNARLAAQYIWALRRLVVGPEKKIWQPKKRKSSQKLLPLASGKKYRTDTADGMQEGNPPSVSGKRRRRNVRDTQLENIPLVSGETCTSNGGLVVEVLWDSTHFANKDIQVNVVYCPVQDVAAYVPPMSLRHLRWRTSEAGDLVSGQDWEQFEKFGFRLKGRMESFDCIKYLNHILEVGFGKSLLTFACPATLERMKAGSVRIYHRASKRWYRVEAEDRLTKQSASASGADIDARGVPELPNELLNPSLVNVLLATIDQKQSQWTAMHCCTSPQGLNLMFAFRVDSFHRSWRDFQFTTSHAKGGFHHSSCQLNYALNVNYQQGYFLAKRGEINKEWQVMFPEPGPKFKALYHNMALDARVSPSTSGAFTRALYVKHVLDNETYDKKGIFFKSSAWYCIIKLLMSVDKVWHARRYMAEEVADMLLKSQGKKAKEQACEMAAQVLAFMENPSDSGESKVAGKEAYKAEMRALRKRVGNALLLAPRLMHSSNLVNARIMLLVSRVAWTEQSLWSQLKTTPQQDRESTVKYATGLGEVVLKRMWKDALFDFTELHRLGWQIVENAPVTDLALVSGEVPDLNSVIPERLMSFLCHFVEARWWSYAWACFALPEAFAAVLAEGRQAIESLQFLRELWDAATFAEAIQNLSLIHI